MPYGSYNKRKGAPGDDLRSYEERVVQEALRGLPLPFEYESTKLDYTLRKKYTPDFSIPGVHVEVKGWWPPEDRTKLKAVRLAHPDDIILVVLSRPNTTISKTSKTTYAQWCDKWGISWVPFDKDPAVVRQWVENVLSKFISRVHSAPVQMGLLTVPMGPSTASSVPNPAGPMADHKTQSPTASSP
jgi:hypothetical protein